jgi:hypothetical protein
MALGKATQSLIRRLIPSKMNFVEMPQNGAGAP